VYIQALKIYLSCYSTKLAIKIADRVGYLEQIPPVESFFDTTVFPTCLYAWKELYKLELINEGRTGCEKNVGID
jgi:hypothetical protein